jgi:hypothetical protein
MIDHLALLCPKVPSEVRQIFLEEIMKRSVLKSSHDPPNNNNETATKKKQKKITSMFESSELEKAKITRYNCALTQLFICCSLPFKVVFNPFFIDFIKNLCPAYELPNCVMLAGPWINQELINILTITNNEVKSSRNITLGLDGWKDPNYT